MDIELPAASDAAPGNVTMPAYKRVLLKLSGEALAASAGYGIDGDMLEQVASEVEAVHEAGVELALVIGGGNIFRGVAGTTAGMDRTSADHMGMLATVMNAIAMQDALESRGVPTRVMSAISMRQIAEPYIRRRAMRHLEKGRLVIFAAGTGNPYFTTDTAAALRAAEINADVLLKATKVDGVYDADPMKVPSARMLPELSHHEALSRRLKVMDSTALSLCMDNRLPIVIFNLHTPGNIQRVLSGERIGTLVRADDLPTETGSVDAG